MSYFWFYPRAQLDRMEQMMADLTTAVSDLTAAVAAVAGRLGPSTTDLQAALTEAQAALDAMTAVDAADKQALADALAASQTAADSIETQVGTLNSIGQPPAV